MFNKYVVDLTITRDMLGTNPADPSIHDTHIIQKQRKLIQEKGNYNSEINKYIDALQISEERSKTEVDNLLDKIEALLGRKFTEEERAKAIKGELESLKETLDEQELRGVTVFFRDKKGMPCIGDHMIKGFLKAAAEAIARTLPSKKGTMLHSAAYTESIINQHVTTENQFISFDTDVVKNEQGQVKYYERSLRAMTAQGPRVSIAKSEYVLAGAKLKFTLLVLQGSPLTLDALKKLFSYGRISGLGQNRNSGFGQFTAEITEVE
jgi:hypothetical protein